MNHNKHHIFTLLAATLAVAALPNAAVRAQDGGDVATTAPKGAIIKGRAPVSKELLKVSLPRPKEFKLKNGVRVLVLEDHRSPTVSMTLYVRAGTLYAANPALAGVTAALLNEGTTTRDGQKLAEEADDLGANVQANAAEEWATLSVSGLSESADAMLDLASDVLLHPSFPEDRLRRFKALRIGGIQQGRTNPDQIVRVVENHVLYAGTPYERVQPTREQVMEITRDSAQAFWQERWRPNGALIAVSGDVDAKQYVARLDKVLADWKSGTDAPPLPKASNLKPKETARVYLVDRPGSQQTVLEFGNIGLSRKDKDYYALVVANHILGGGSSGRLFGNLREDKGFTYGAYSRLSAPASWPGLWTANASVRTAVTGPAAVEFGREFARIQNTPVSDDELARAKRALIGSFARTLESPTAILGRTVELVQNDLPLDYWDKYPSRIEAITKADVQRVAQTYLGTNRIQLFAVGERSAIEDVLKPLGPLSFYDALGNPVSDKPTTGTDAPASDK